MLCLAPYYKKVFLLFIFLLQILSAQKITYRRAQLADYKALAKFSNEQQINKDTIKNGQVYVASTTDKKKEIIVGYLLLYIVFDKDTYKALIKKINKSIVRNSQTYSFTKQNVHNFDHAINHIEYNNNDFKTPDEDDALLFFSPGKISNKKEELAITKHLMQEAFRCIVDILKRCALSRVLLLYKNVDLERDAIITRTFAELTRSVRAFKKRDTNQFFVSQFNLSAKRNVLEAEI